MNKFKILTITTALMLCQNSIAATYNLFSPASGVLKGSTSTYITTAAVSSDIRTMWTGTCNSSTFLRGDGACAAAGGGSPGGSDTQVQFNDSTAFGGSADFTYAKTTNIITVGSVATPGIIKGADNASGVGAIITLKAGSGNATNGGGAVTVSGGPGGATSGNGGNATLKGGVPIDGDGGNVNITGTAGVGTNRGGGTITATGGNASGTNAGGSVIYTAGNGGATGTAGDVSINAGAGGTTSGNGGLATLRGGLPVDGNGGSVSITARDGIGTNRNGGNITLTLGAATGGGTVGALTLVGGTATGAQTATFVASNKPGSATGAPSLWLRVVVSGTTFWIPLFAN